jgi:hypothetical protein
MNRLGFGLCYGLCTTEQRPSPNLALHYLDISIG